MSDDTLMHDPMPDPELQLGPPLPRRRKVTVWSAEHVLYRVRKQRWYGYALDDWTIEQLIEVCQDLVFQLKYTQGHWKVNRSHRWLRRFAHHLRVANARAAAAPCRKEPE